MKAKALLTALALGGAAVYAAKRLSSARNGNAKTNSPKKMKSQRDGQAFSAVRTPTPPY